MTGEVTMSSDGRGLHRPGGVPFLASGLVAFLSALLEWLLVQLDPDSSERR